MSDLFGLSSDGAEFSSCGKYRYALWRIWDKSKPLLMYIGLNPSTANQNSDDPTIRRVKNFTHKFGYGGFYMMNLYAFITPYPEELQTESDPIGENDNWLELIAIKCDKVVFCWGSFKGIRQRALAVSDKFYGCALSVNADGSPGHPLYLPKSSELIEYRYV